MKRSFRAIVVVSSLACLAAAPAGAPTMRDVLAASFRLRDLGEVNLSTDGSVVAWQETYRDPRQLLHSPRYRAVYARPLGSGRAIRLSAGAASGNYDEESPVWSPDGRKVAFLSDARSPRQLQLFVADRDGSHVRQVGKLSGDVQHLSWAPSGNALAFLYIPSARREAGALMPGARDVGVIGATVDEQRLAVIGIDGGTVRMLSRSDDYVYEYGWSPDGRQVAVTYAKGNGDNNWWVARLARIEVATGAMRDLLAPSYQIDDPQWSPDGAKIAIVGGIMSDFGSTGGDVYLVDAKSGESRDVTDGAPYSVQSLRWNDSRSLDLIAHASGSMRLMRLDVSGGTTALTSLTSNPESLWSWSSARHGSVVALVRASFDAPPEVWAGAPGALRQITQSNAGATRLYGKAVSLQWKSDEFDVQGWLIYPLDFDPKRTYPMVTIVHGGPSAASVPSFGSRNLAALCSAGYFVFMPNPRGSFGRGEAFARANVKDFGYGDWRDDLAGIDAAIKSAPIDPNRLGLFGWSYGGYMAMWGETQTARFKAIVAGAGIVSWQSYYGQNKIDQWMIPFFGASVYTDP
ncbi:MAG TPA: prolyl oligopeptidase family serine peptidase, partial [Candidatus Nitrosotalea sp.]|nr:prolyl oligopeptidase family serine peptidase [Candidatus Nitrosotalea sp.]